MTIERAIKKMESCSIVPFMEDDCEAAVLATAALREKQARDKGCVWCKENNKVFHDGQHFHMFCSYCGRRLEVKHE